MAAITTASGFSSPAVGYSSFVLRIKGMRGQDLNPLMIKGSGWIPGTPISKIIEGKEGVLYPCSDDDATGKCGVYFYAFSDTAISMAGRQELIAEALRQLP
ncbi:MAG: hypothetical protein M3P18_14970 [Actinomycetota bacterium]|nr:hypothetical protein [Actinomycetota bacterium]